MYIEGINVKDKLKIKKSIILNVLLKPIAMILSLLYTPVILRYLGAETYGLWTTISSTISWILTFDVGIGNGLRNRLVESLDKGDIKASKHLISTAYVSLSLITMAIFIFFLVINCFVNWNSFFNTEENVGPIIIITVIAICMSFILSLINTISFSLQRSEEAAYRGVIIQLINFIAIFFFSLRNDSGIQLTIVALITGLSPIIVYGLSSIATFSRHKTIAPSIRYFKKDELHNICDLGLKFFLIQIVGLILFSTDSLIITKIIDNIHVTSYNMVYKIFGLSMTIFNAILAPLWSGFTLAKSRRDYKWIKGTIKKVKMVWILFSAALLLAVFIYKPITGIWLKTKLEYDKGLVICMAVYFIVYMYSGIYSIVLNGFGEVNIQLILGIISAILNIPFSIVLANGFGLQTTGICLGTIISMMVGNIAFTIQVNKILEKEHDR